MKNIDEKYLQLLSKKFDTEEKIITEIINLEAILNLPKGTEHLVSDLHGEFEAVRHVLFGGSGNVREKVRLVFEKRLSDEEITELCTLIYYPKEKLAQVKKEQGSAKNLHDWYRETLYQLIEVVEASSTKYTRSKLRKAIPEQFAYIIEELLYRRDETHDKKAYYHVILESTIALGQADKMLIALSDLIKRLVVDHVHVVGDIFDRGPAPDKIMEMLIAHHSVDIQWGNHDILWMGAFCGSSACLANLIRICARYDNLDVVEDAYGINLRPLLAFAEKYYEDNPVFHPKKSDYGEVPNPEEHQQITKIHQAIAIMQFKIEAEVIARNPEFEMAHRILLDKIDYQKNEITIGDTVYPLVGACFSAIDPENPLALSEEERMVLEKIRVSFMESEKLARHVKFLFQKGSLYLTYNNNLLIHGCVPMQEDGTFSTLSFGGKPFTGPALLDEFERLAREGYRLRKREKEEITDIFWYLWCGKDSPLFGKQAMTTFERYFISEKETYHEALNPYYELRKDEKSSVMILEAFGLLSETGHIINGHTPIKEIKGELPIKANGKTIIIDGGFSRAYHETTGIGGYTLLYNSYGMQLVAHKPFISVDEALKDGQDILFSKRLVDRSVRRQKVSETETGKLLRDQVEDLKALLAYHEVGEYKQ